VALGQDFKPLDWAFFKIPIVKNWTFIHCFLNNLIATKE
jgi:hypothetical protein